MLMMLFSKQVMADRPTPRSIGVCALIALRSDPSSPLHEIEFNPNERDNMAMFLMDSVSRHSVASLLTWVQSLERFVGVAVKALVLETICMASESVDALVDLMDSLRAAVVEGLADAVSVHGVYLRQICLGFEQLSFESVTFLWQELRNQLDSVAGVREHGGRLTVAAKEQNPRDTQTWQLSNTQVEELLQQSCRQLESAHYSFEKVELRVRAMLEAAPETSAAYFLRFLNSLRHKDRSAMDALHQYFDHAMIQKQKSTKEIIQFSAILLTLLHENFGDSALALMATEEAVRVAQQSKDSTCVAFALGKLFQNDGKGLTGRREILTRCAARATQDQLRTLLLGAKSALSLDYLQNPDRDPSVIWTQLVEANSEPTADRIPRWDRPTCLRSSPKETINDLQRQCYIEAGVWASLGVPILSSLASLVVLDCFQQSSVDDTVLALRNRARLCHHGIPSVVLSDVDSFPMAASKHTHANDPDALSPQDYLFPHVLCHIHERSLQSYNIDLAHVLETILQSSLPPGTATRIQMTMEIGIRICHRLCRSKNLLLARKLALELLQSCEDTRTRAKLHLLLATMELESSSISYTSALPPLLEAIAICEQSSIYDLHAVGLLTLARTFLRMRKSKRALSILGTAIPALLACGHFYHQAEAYLTQAKCYLQLATHRTTDDDLRSSLNRSWCEEALLGLKASERLFQKCHNKCCLKEVFYLQSRIAFLLGRVEACEIASAKFIRLLHTYGHGASLLDSLVIGINDVVSGAT